MKKYNDILGQLTGTNHIVVNLTVGGVLLFLVYAIIYLAYNVVTLGGHLN